MTSRKTGYLRSKDRQPVFLSSKDRQRQTASRSPTGLEVAYDVSKDRLSSFERQTACLSVFERQAVCPMSDGPGTRSHRHRKEKRSLER